MGTSIQLQGIHRLIQKANSSSEASLLPPVAAKERGGIFPESVTASIWELGRILGKIFLFSSHSADMFPGFSLFLYTITTESEICLRVWNFNLPLNALTSSHQPAQAKVLM